MPGTLIVSLDFELFWGMLEVHALEDYQANVLGGREAIPQLLKLFEKYNIHATWATVGFMFAENREELKLYFPEPQLRPSYTNEKLDPYSWFEKIGEDEQEAPCFFAPSLIRLVSQAPGQEIGSHTFCHYYCREEGQTPQQFAADAKAARRIAADHGYDVTSVVLPRNQSEPEYAELLHQAGFTAFRDEEHDWIHEKVKCWPLLRALRLVDAYLPITGYNGYHPKMENGICNVMGSGVYRAIFPRLRFLEGLKIHRIKMQMRHAAKKGLTYHLWWHPHNLGLETETHLQQLEDILSYYQRMKERYGMVSLNMREAAEKYGNEVR